MEFTLAAFLTFCSFFQHTEGAGLDLNPAVLGCILSGGNCLENTGIPILNKIFGDGGDAFATPSRKCFNFQSHHYWVSIGRSQCEDAKISFWVKNQKWPYFKHTMDLLNYQSKKREEFKHAHRIYDDEGNNIVFECTSKQREIFIKHKCKSVGA